MLAPVKPDRSWWKLLLLVPLLPWLAAVGLGLPSRAGGRIDGWLHQLLFFTSDAVPFAELAFGGWIAGTATVGVLAGLLLVLSKLDSRAPKPILWLLALPEAALALLGLLAATGLFAVGAGLDRVLLWSGLAIALVGARVVHGQVLTPGAARCQDLTMNSAWVDRRNRGWRFAGLAVAAGLVLLAGVTLLEGPGYHSPPFRLRELWLAGPGRSGWTSGGLWLVAGVVAVVRARRSRPKGRWLAGIGARLAVVVLVEAVGAPGFHYGVASALSAVGLLLLAASWPALATRLPVLRGHPADPRRLWAGLLPLLFWCALCAARGLTVFMRTAPGELPPGVERIAEVPGAFSLAVEPRTGALLWSERDRQEIGVLFPDGNVAIRPVDGPDAPEELIPARDGLVWASLAGEETTGVVGVHPVTGVRWPGLAFPSRCWISGFVPLPPQAAAAVELPLGTVLAGCEQGGELFLLTPDLRIGAVRPVPEEIEQAAFSADGDLYLVGLWAGSSVWRLSWPGLRVRARRTIGSFNWGVVADDERELVWVTRFFEGRLLALDAETLEPRRTVPLSFGLRALVHEPVCDRLWVAAAYSGRVWMVNPADPGDRRSWALCGQSRAIVPDGTGRVVVATDCGLFRIDPGIAR